MLAMTMKVAVHTPILTVLPELNAISEIAFSKNKPASVAHLPSRMRVIWFRFIHRNSKGKA